jgi:integrase/recombinase XerD
MTWQERNKDVLKRMSEDLSLRNLAAATIELYTYHVRRFGEFIGHSLDEATPEQIRSFQLHLIQVKKASWSAFNQTVCGLRFLYRITLPRPWGVSMIPFGKRPKPLPAVLGPGEVDKLLQCVPSIKHRTLLLTLYAAGLRLGEATALTIGDIDSERMMLRIARGKGNKERLVPMSPRLLAALREYWRHVRPTHYLFPGLTFEARLNATTIQKTCRFAAVKAGLAKHVTPHTLRHSYATGLLEAGVDLLTIGRLLGHTSFLTTMVYLHVRRPHLDSTPSPIDWLPVRQLPGWQQPSNNSNSNNNH